VHRCKARDEIIVFVNTVAIEELWCTVLSHSLCADVFSEILRQDKYKNNLCNLNLQLIWFLCRYFEMLGAVHTAKIKESLTGKQQEEPGKENPRKL